ncbi:MAG: molecular chaperone TorD family protein [Alphaproteobacteria bacterium]|nr:molecular chaperone TorD family protein [Alphaproteobacteria bacterium]
MRASGLAEPEDHIAFLCEVMVGLINGACGTDGLDDSTFFRRHLAPWARGFFADLERHDIARFYRAVGTLGRVAMEIEAAALELPA